MYVLAWTGPNGTMPKTYGGTRLKDEGLGTWCSWFKFSAHCRLSTHYASIQVALNSAHHQPLRMTCMAFAHHPKIRPAISSHAKLLSSLCRVIDLLELVKRPGIVRVLFLFNSLSFVLVWLEKQTGPIRSKSTSSALKLITVRIFGYGQCSGKDRRSAIKTLVM